MVAHTAFPTTRCERLWVALNGLKSKSACSTPILTDGPGGIVVVVMRGRVDVEVDDVVSESAPVVQPTTSKMSATRAPALFLGSRSISAM